MINVVYTKDSFGYTVEYYQDGKLIEGETVTGTAEFGSKITSFYDIAPIGTYLEKVVPDVREEATPLIITEIADNNVIRVYYKSYPTISITMENLVVEYDALTHALTPTVVAQYKEDNDKPVTAPITWDDIVTQLKEGILYDESSAAPKNVKVALDPDTNQPTLTAYKVTYTSGLTQATKKLLTLEDANGIVRTYYITALEDAELTIKPAELTVTAEDKEMVANDTKIPDLTYTIDGAKGDDVIANVVTGTPKLDVDVQKDADTGYYEAGVYEIIAEKGELALVKGNNNYTFAFVDGKLTVKDVYHLTIIYRYAATQVVIRTDEIGDFPEGEAYGPIEPMYVASYAPSMDVIEGTMPAYDLTIEVFYTIVPAPPPPPPPPGPVLYTLTVEYAYAATGEVFDSITAEFEAGETYGPYESLVVDGFTPDIELVTGVMPGNDLTIRVLYTGIVVPTYTITYEVRGGSFGTDWVQYGNTVRYEAGETVTMFLDPAAQDGYTFSGWDQTIATMPANDVVIRGEFTGNPPVPTPTPVPIDDEATPLAAPRTPAWALLNLILAIATALTSAILLIGYIGKKKKDDDGIEKEIKKRGGWRLGSLIPGIGAIIAFILTENMRNPMVFTDRWTLLMVVIAVVQVAVVFMSLKSEKEPEETPAA